MPRTSRQAAGECPNSGRGGIGKYIQCDNCNLTWHHGCSKHEMSFLALKKRYNERWTCPSCRDIMRHISKTPSPTVSQKSRIADNPVRQDPVSPILTGQPQGKGPGKGKRSKRPAMSHNSQPPGFLNSQKDPNPRDIPRPFTVVLNGPLGTSALSTHRHHKPITKRRKTGRRKR